MVCVAKISAGVPLLMISPPNFPFGTYVNHIIRAFNHVFIVLDHNRIPDVT
jgi:hypothetical protein